VALRTIIGEVSNTGWRSVATGTSSFRFDVEVYRKMAQIVPDAFPAPIRDPSSAVGVSSPVEERRFSAAPGTRNTSRVLGSGAAPPILARSLR
jgi:hypothetical protein